MPVITPETMESIIRHYFDDCNRGDPERIARWFVPEAVHYFPDGSPFGVLQGAEAIGACWANCVARLGSYWTVDNFLGDEKSGQAVIEWSHFKRKLGQILRGDEWYRFTADGKIREIRAYYACPLHAGINHHGLGGFDYATRGYPLSAPELT